ncbi:MAG TPA: hypothetical protein VHT96_08680 [Clostridia bacterium]|nr:hypothetical protein [Clostridia bacterium]
MKKLTALLIMAAILIVSFIPAVAEGIYVASGNGDRIRILEDVNVTQPVNGNVVAVLGDITVNSQVNGHVIAVFGEVKVNSLVSGQVVTVFGQTDLGSNAKVMGDVITMGSLNEAAGAQVLGQQVRILGKSMNLDIGAILYLQLVIMLLFTVVVLIAGLLILLIARTSYSAMAKNIEKNLGRKMLLGVLTFMGASALLLLLLVTLIAPLLYIIVLVLAMIPASMFAGRYILKTFSPKNSIYMEFITGLISLTLLKLLVVLLVPQGSILIGFGLTGLIDLLIYSLGLGIHMEQHYLKGNTEKK